MGAKKREAMAAAKLKTEQKMPTASKVYTLEVSIVSGPITEEFAKKNKSVARTIQICAIQTLKDLHDAIFNAFDRDDPHMYEFQMGKRPMDPKGSRYTESPDHFGSKVLGMVRKTKISEMNLRINQIFWYWFDFGDDWHHRIVVKSIMEATDEGEYPRVIERVGDSPPQYPNDEDWDDEEIEG